jgi:hypothetical protein
MVFADPEAFHRISKKSNLGVLGVFAVICVRIRQKPFLGVLVDLE